LKPGDRTPIPTIAQVVERATAICDPTGTDTAVRALYDAFEDDERPSTAPEDLAAELGETVRAVDPEGDSPAALMAVASAVWLATNMDQAERHEHVLREAARLRYGTDAPATVADWLAERQIDV
jgi:hypothetical protein